MKVGQLQTLQFHTQSLVLFPLEESRLKDQHKQPRGKKCFSHMTSVCQRRHFAIVFFLSTFRKYRKRFVQCAIPTMLLYKVNHLGCIMIFVFEFLV